MNNNPLRIIQISDTHLLADAEASLLGVNTLKSFQAVIDLAKKEREEIDFIIHSGDITQDGSEAAYLRLATLLEPFNIPIYYVPGNHDDVTIMSTIFPRGNICSEKHIVANNWQLIFLNSQKVGKVEGFLDAGELKLLEHRLQKYPQFHAAIIFHHQPVAVGSEWLDRNALTNAAELWQVLSAYPQVKAIISGHVHQDFVQTINGVTCYSSPSTCIQFKRQQDHFGLEKLSPGYRWIHLHASGQIETGIKRTEEYVGVFDEKAKGY